MQAVLIPILILLCAGSLPAQHVSAWLPPDHWSIAAVARLHALGVTRAFDAATRQHTTASVASALLDARSALADQASDQAGSLGGDAADRATVLRLVDSYLKRFAEEYPRAYGHAAGAVTALRIDANASAGVRVREQAWLAGRFTPERVWTGAQRLPDLAGFGSGAWLGLTAGDRGALTVAGVSEGGAARLTHASADVAVGPAAFWVGRRSPGYAPAAGGGFVLDGAVAFEGAGVYPTRPVRAPLLGVIRGELFGGTIETTGAVERPWLLGMRLYASPHSRLDVGATRVAVFGGLDGARVGVLQLLEVLVGANLGGDYADDQVASIDARWRPAARIPIEVYGEWGVHDASPRVFVQMPTFALGVGAPLLLASAFDAAIEHTRFARSCCSFPPWYHHFQLADSWTEHGVPLGHPLGGHGHEWRMRLTGAPLAARLLLDAAVFRRTRAEQNLYSPQRFGRSTGAAASLVVRITERVGLDTWFYLEDGQSGTETHVALLARARL